jgi:hypothetical protein
MSEGFAVEDPACYLPVKQEEDPLKLLLSATL